MHELEKAALISVGRAYGFAWLAIMCIMFAFFFEPPLAAMTGGTLCMALTAVLGVYAWYAVYRRYDRTELWMILPVDERPPAGVAQQVIGQVLRETYTWFARQAAIVTLVLFAIGVTLRFLGVNELPGTERAKSSERPFTAVLVDESGPAYGLRFEVTP